MTDEHYSSLSSEQKLKIARLELREITDRGIPEPGPKRETTKVPEPANEEDHTDHEASEIESSSSALERVKKALNELRIKANLPPLPTPPPKAFQPTQKGSSLGGSYPRSNLWKVWDESTEIYVLDGGSLVTADFDCLF
ncbi:hypothetical protein GLAREA_01923 [Glarea lozoyensis ATCC 20868]|uniref:Uncharacterized protein n=1 Tax=Glarea lozoyensis (strain ATCC 20868 / MF5171) TaxID=1116229 RepID=S3D1T5_GLAL2|nr:uncharacterized protein GLAREA_01923 [Glarea lozoyensis ATCC 20868]EPE26011.1 hypothetical protein GLAREA_01923 [Glarea lozoyensis ATCC 20868]